MNLKQLSYFAVLAEEKQVTAAAKRLFISQPVLSYELKQLQLELGVTLFNRTSHGVELTNAGEMLSAYAQQILHLTEAAQNNVIKAGRGELGTLSLGTVSSSNGFLQNRQMRGLRSLYPQVKLDVFEGNTYHLLDLLRNRTLDLAILRTPFNHRGLHVVTLLKEPMVAVSQAQLTDQPEIDLPALAQQPLIIYRRFEHLLGHSFAEAGLDPYFAIVCDDARSTLVWASEEMGTAILPASVAATVPLHRYRIRARRWETELQLAWRKDETLSPLGQKIVNSLQQ
ncbi:MAG: LysR family transcriptional regulator [Lactobacillus sp.]|jgi:DNA-binding transcriptional LysR family regulator|nr:LysR family transcriptional regulator [Lactobacillus sp.]MCH3906190.1 LysR family transcriptional regulator [Lactobacillus sp.]MCH3990233.1 LysR family transcriptional regulator [Lactobacillus sp.]MCH4069053.1 LysR family transcriptional regulator [Lactobacillus sp.]MCI1303455.1 LysR family transcriptional regulator [Lactobacillus sp.]